MLHVDEGIYVPDHDISGKWEKDPWQTKEMTCSRANQVSKTTIAMSDYRIACL